MHDDSTDRSYFEQPYNFQRLVGFQLVEWEPFRAVLHLPLRADHANRTGLPHGGLHATLLDTAMGYSGCYTGTPEQRIDTLTLMLNVSFLSRPRGRTLIAEGRRVGGGHRTFFAEGQVTDETGELIATGSAAFRYRGDEPAA